MNRVWTANSHVRSGQITVIGISAAVSTDFAMHVQYGSAHAASLRSFFGHDVRAFQTAVALLERIPRRAL